VDTYLTAKKSLLNMTTNELDKKNLKTVMRQEVKWQFLTDSLLASETVAKELIKSWIDNEIIQSELIYRGSDNGFTTEDFHYCCDN
jgi:hypothetical protein